MTEVQPGGRARQAASPELRRLARRDVKVAAAGLVATAACALLQLAAALDLIGDRFAHSVVVALALVAGFACFVWWTAGPRELRGSRVIVIAPVFLLAMPALYSLYQLGGGVITVLVSSLVGFSAAIAAGLALSSRRAR